MKIFTTRIAGFILSFALILGAVLVPESPVVAEEINQNAMKAVDLFRSLEVIPDYYDYNIDMRREVSRADFVHAVYKLVGPEGYTGTHSYYYDVTENHWAFDAICYLTEQGILHGSDTKIFEPDETIEKAAAYKIILTLLGYGEYANYNGGYPMGYTMIAKRLGISDGCSSAPTLSMEDMLIVLFKGATCGIFEAKSFEDDGAIFEVSNDRTLFSTYKDLHYQRGVVEGANMTSIGSMKLAEENDVVIGGELYQTEIELYDYLGEEVEILYHYWNSSEKKTVVWAYRTGYTDVLTIEADNDASFRADSFTLKYFDKNERERTLQLDKNIRMVFNGGETTRAVSDILNLPRYTAKLVGRGNDYTVAMVTAPEIMIIGNINKNDEKVYDKLKPTESISLKTDDYEYLNITLQGKEPIEFKDLSVGNVLSIYRSEDGERLEIKVGNMTVEGVVAQVWKKSNGTVYAVGGEEYYQADGVQNDEFSAGDIVTLYLDVEGRIAYIQSGVTGDYAVFLMGAALSDDVFEQDLKVRYIGQDGIIYARECRKNVVIDGVSFKDVTKAYRALCNQSGEFVPQIALIDYNSEGQIIAIDTPTRTKAENEHTLTVNVPYKTGQRYKWFGQIGSLSPVDNNTVFFAVPDDASMATAEDDDFAVIKRADLVNDSSHSLETYKTAVKSEFEQYVVLKGYSNKSLRNADNPILVTNLGKMVDAEGTVVENLEGFLGTEVVSIPARSGYSLSELGIGKGDLVQVRKNNSGEIVNAEVKVDFDNLDSAVSSSATFNDSYRLIVGYVHDIVGSVVKIGETDPAAYTHVTQISGIPVLIYDDDSRTPVTIGELNDADTWYNAEAKCSRVVLLTKTASPQLMVIYK